jgi:hypothetical protein
MFLPIAFAIMLAAVGFQLGRSKDKSFSPWRTNTGAETPFGRPAASALNILNTMVAARKIPPLNLLEVSFAEAQRLGDQQLAAFIAKLCIRLYPLPPQVQQPQQVTSGAELAPQEQEPEFDGTPESWGEMANPSVALPQEHPITPPQTPNQGFWESVDKGKWNEFCKRLKTKEPAYRADNYLGAFEHNRRRLRQLGIDEGTLSSEDAQYRALLADLGNHHDNCKALVEEFGGGDKTIEVDGKPTTVTKSGVLALLKAAGPRGAEGWLRNPEERKMYPNTTEIFLRCNGCF